MTMRARCTRLLALALLVAAAAPGLVAQGPLNPRGQRNLSFGTVFPGVPRTVTPADATAGRFQIRGQRNAEVRIDFVLPLALTSRANDLTLQFTAGDGAWAPTNQVASATRFDPRLPLTARLSTRGRLFLFLGGSAIPTAQQPSGRYRGTVTITAAYTGN